MKRRLLFFYIIVFIALCFSSYAGAVSPIEGLPCELQWIQDPANSHVWKSTLSNNAENLYYEKDGTRYLEITYGNGCKYVFKNTPPSYKIITESSCPGSQIDYRTDYYPWDYFCSMYLCDRSDHSRSINEMKTNWISESLKYDPSSSEKKVLYFFNSDLECTPQILGLGWIRHDPKLNRYYQVGIYRTSDGSEVIVKRYTNGFVIITIIEPDGTVTEIEFYEKKSTKVTDVIVKETKNGKKILSVATTNWNDFLTQLLCGTIQVWFKPKEPKLALNPHLDLIGISLQDTTIDDSFQTNTECQYPDLTISRLYAPDIGTAGSTLLLSVTVLNAGSVPSGKSVIEVRLSQGSAVLRPSVQISSLQPGEEKVIALPIPIPDNTKGPGILTVVLDPDNTENECNEYNNEDSTNIRILPAGVTADDYTSQTASPSHKVTSGSGGSGGGGGGGGCPTCDT